MSSDWLTGLSASLVIGQSNYFGFGFTTLNKKPLQGSGLYIIRGGTSFWTLGTIFQILYIEITRDAALCDCHAKSVFIIFQTFGTEAKLEGFVWSHQSEHKSANISLPTCTRMLLFGKGTFFVMPFPNI